MLSKAISILWLTLLGAPASAAQTAPSDTWMGEISAAPPTEACLVTRDIASYRVLSPSLVELKLLQTPREDTDQQTGIPLQPLEAVLMELGPTCPQLAFHGYFTYVPVDGLLCAGRDTVRARSGNLCAIRSFSGHARVLTTQAPRAAPVNPQTLSPR